MTPEELADLRKLHERNRDPDCIECQAIDRLLAHITKLEQIRAALLKYFDDDDRTCPRYPECTGCSADGDCDLQVILPARP